MWWRKDADKKRDFLLNLLPKRSAGAEIGVWKGDFSARILKLVRPARLHLIDPWKHEPSYEGAWYGGGGMTQSEMDLIYETVCRRFHRQMRRGQARIHRMSSIAAADSFAPGELDWVYIDGNHLYPFVKADLETFWTKVKSGGLLCGDDYGQPNSWWQDGVTRAVDEFVQTHDCSLEVRNHQYILRGPK